MSRKELERLIGTALTSPTFCERLLDGARYQVIGDFDLTLQERGVLLDAEARSLQELAVTLVHWLDRAGERVVSSR